MITYCRWGTYVTPESSRSKRLRGFKNLEPILKQTQTLSPEEWHKEFNRLDDEGYREFGFDAVSGNISGYNIPIYCELGTGFQSFGLTNLCIFVVDDRPQGTTVDHDDDLFSIHMGQFVPNKEQKHHLHLEGQHVFDDYPTIKIDSEKKALDLFHLSLLTFEKHIESKLPDGYFKDYLTWAYRDNDDYSWAQKNPSNEDEEKLTLLALRLKQKLKEKAQEWVRRLKNPSNIEELYQTLWCLYREIDPGSEGEREKYREYLNRDSFTGCWEGIFKTRNLQPVARWIDLLIIALTNGELIPNLERIRAYPLKTGDVILKTKSAKIDHNKLIILDRAEHKIGEIDRACVAGLPSKLLNRILAQRGTAILVDSVEWAQSRFDQSTDGRFKIEGGWTRVAKEMGDRFQIKINQQRLREAMLLLSIMKINDGTGCLASIMGVDEQRVGYGRLVNFTALHYMTQTSHERLIPWLNAPRGQGAQRKTYAYLRLALSHFFVEHSKIYLNTGEGVYFAENEMQHIHYLSGVKLLSSVKRALNDFEDAGVIERQGRHLRLGSLNKHQEGLILKGAQRQISGRQGGKISARKKKKKLED